MTQIKENRSQGNLLNLIWSKIALKICYDIFLGLIENVSRIMPTFEISNFEFKWTLGTTLSWKIINLIEKGTSVIIQFLFQKIILFLIILFFFHHYPLSFIRYYPIYFSSINRSLRFHFSFIFKIETPSSFQRMYDSSFLFQFWNSHFEGVNA